MQFSSALKLVHCEFKYRNDFRDTLYNLANHFPMTVVSSFLRTQQSRCLPPPHLRTETDPVSETLFFRITDDGQSPKTQ
jgi:hypothetical protein